MSSTPGIRIQRRNRAPERPERGYVLYWMIACRRAAWSFPLQRAVEAAERLGKPLVVLEALRSDYPWASDRLHRFLIQGMADNRSAFEGKPVTYYPWLETAPGSGSGLLAALAGHACLVVSDEYPCFFLPRMVRAAAQRLDVRLETVDGNGLLPLGAADRVWARARDFRRFLQQELPSHLAASPDPDPLCDRDLPRLTALPTEALERWAPAEAVDLEQPDLSRLPIDHDVAPVSYEGGSRAAGDGLAAFVEERLPRYESHRLDLDCPATSGLSPYLHFGHVSAHQVFAAVARAETWSPDRLSDPLGGQARGWWGMSDAAEAFLDQLVTWRELGFHTCAHETGWDRFSTLPDWARATLEHHEKDPRPYLYSLEELETATTHDEIWNAAQRELLRTGRIHNYLRMLWGKKILEWSPTPREALQRMISLNDKYAVDGRDPNSYSGISWCLGRYDRAWGPEREIFGKVRYMSSESARRKLTMGRYLERFGPGRSGAEHG